MKKIFTLFAALVCVLSMSAVTYNVTVPAGTKACYIAGDMNSWSFTEMTKVDDTHYTLDLPSATKAMKYKYCSGPGWAYVEKDASGNEIGDRAYSAEDVVAKWASVYDPGNVPTPGEAKDITIKAKVPATWTNTITAWVWPTGGAGKEVTPAKEGEWYVYTEKCSELNIIFKNGTGWNGDINQTVDITISESTCVEITAGTGKATYTIVDCEENPGENPGEEPGDDPVVDPETGVTYNVTVPVGTKACYIAGEMNSWSFTEMTKIDDTHYTVTLAEATEAMGYKYCSGPGWAYVELTEEDGEVANRTYAANDVVVKWASVYDPANAPTPGEAKDITIKAKVPATWTNTITAWVWPTGEPGKAVTPTKEGEWYVYTEHCSELNIIFRNGEDWSINPNQTVDITVSESTCIEIIAGTDKATYTIVDCEDNPGEEPGDDPVVTPTDATYVLMGVGGDWETGIAFTRNEANTLEEEYMLLDQVISEGDAVKVVGIVDGVATYYNTVDEASVSHTLSEDFQNIVLAPGIYDFYFKVASQVIYIGASLPSAVDNVTVEGKAVKVIRNGQMYILRDGVMYNAVGQIAE